MSNLSTSAPGELLRQTEEQMLEFQDAQYAGREQVRLQEELSMKEKFSDHETIQQLTSQLQQMQEQMSSLSDSGEFQDVESHESGRLFHVSVNL